MAINNIEIQDSNGNVYHPHTSADVVFGADKRTVEQSLLANTAAIAAIPSTPLNMSAPITAGGAQDLATKQVRNVTISPNDPSGGSNGDMWFKYS